MSYRKARTKRDKIKLMTYVQCIQQSGREKKEQMYVYQLHKKYISVSCECCLLSEVSATADHSSRGSSTECDVFECDCESSIMGRRLRPTGGC